LPLHTALLWQPMVVSEPLLNEHVDWSVHAVLQPEPHD
jgi:hypothetical protein